MRYQDKSEEKLYLIVNDVVKISIQGRYNIVLLALNYCTLLDVPNEKEYLAAPF